ncbi:hypothetical protein RS9916_36797 [Synechococcus sp. RS9916]|nr:hypothetical protein RS9916_36797 [Synechococcus sp. RS9916]
MGNLISRKSGSLSTFTVFLNAQTRTAVAAFITGNDPTEGAL